MKNLLKINNRQKGTSNIVGGFFVASVLSMALFTSCTRRDTTNVETREPEGVTSTPATTESTYSDSMAASSDMSGSVDSTADASATGTSSRSYGSAYDQGPSEGAVSGTDTMGDSNGVNSQMMSSDSSMSEQPE